MSFPIFRLLSTLIVASLLLTACTIPAAQTLPAPASEQSTADDHDHAEEEHDHAEEEHDHAEAPGELPTFEPVALAQGEQLLVVATSNIVADIVAQVGGDHIELYSMLPVGADPHSYQVTPADLRMMTDADIVFINGLGLEEAMSLALEDFAAKTVGVNTGFATIEFGGEGEHAHEEEHAEEEEHAHGEDEHHHEGADPHTWFSVHAVETWTHNIAHVLSDLDPTNAEAYEAAADGYTAELETLHAELEALVMEIPADQRKLVTDHDALGYLAAEYGFEVVGSVIPSFSTLSEPSAQELAELQNQIREQGVKAIFVGTTINPQMEAQLAQDLGIQIVQIYTGSLSETDGPAASYLDFMRYTMTAIVNALK
jgi:ABC-type Zn uptake system ZnuABC Zn-binding protein ZnuA